MRPHEGHGSTPPRKKPQRGHPSEAKTYQIAGHTVEIRMGDDHEELRIESVRTKFFRTEDGYNLHAAAYEPPYESLQEAVKAFLTRRKATGKSR